MKARKIRKPIPTAKTKKVDITSGEDKVREVEIPLSEDREIMDGDMLNAVKPTMIKSPPAGYVTVGLSLGATLNVGDYQSARIDAFIIRLVPDRPGAEEAAFAEISEKLNRELNRQAEILLGDSYSIEEEQEEESPKKSRKRGR